MAFPAKSKFSHFFTGSYSSARTTSDAERTSNAGSTARKILKGDFINIPLFSKRKDVSGQSFLQNQSRSPGSSVRFSGPRGSDWGATVPVALRFALRSASEDACAPVALLPKNVANFVDQFFVFEILGFDFGELFEQFPLLARQAGRRDD